MISLNELFDSIIDNIKDFFTIKKEKTNYRFIAYTLISRSCLVALGLYYVIVLSCTTNDNSYYGLTALTGVMLIDTLYVCIFRNGFDFRW